MCSDTSVFCFDRMTLDTAIELLGTLVGALYLYWEYKASHRVWYAGVVMPALSLWVYWRVGLYADFGINVYYLFAAFYGLWAWERDKGNQQYAPITSMPVKECWFMGTLFVVCYSLIGWVLTRYTPSTVPWWDAFTTALSVVGLWMLARKWVEQWLPWIIVDIVSAGLYIYKGIYFFAVLYSVYTIVAVMGYFAWKKKKQ